MNEESWVKVYRKLLDWEWYQDVACKTLFIHLLLIAQYKNYKYCGMDLKAGQVVTAIRTLAKETGLTIQQVRTALKKLQSSDDISIYTTSVYTTITINNWNKYQSEKPTRYKQGEKSQYNAFN